jgi:hypothetical protein
MPPHMDQICQGLCCVSVKVSHYSNLQDTKGSYAKMFIQNGTQCALYYMGKAAK